MSWHDARIKLRAAGWSRAEIQEAHEDWLAQRNERRATVDTLKAVRLKRTLMWKPLIEDVDSEIKSVRSRLQYWTPSKNPAFNSFYALYERTLLAIKIVMRDEISFDDGLAPHVSHWSELMDWAAEKFVLEVHGMKPTQGLRAKILAKYQALPFSEGRRRRPLMSWDVSSERAKHKRLSTGVATTLDSNKRLMLVNPTDEVQADIDKLTQAKHILNDWDFTAPLPATWHGLFK
jgi:hypothetical protein